MIVAGVDEAGRGAVIGPMVICGLSVEAEDENRLRKIGVRDSKELKPLRRERLAKAIEKIAKDIIVLKISPCIIDNYRKDGVNLNRMEALKFADIANYLEPDKIFIDAPDPTTEKLEAFLKKAIKKDGEMVLDHGAENKYPVVGAASIIAKVTRDEEIKQLHKKHGPFGSGYPSDPRTVMWLKNWLQNNKTFPDDFVRRTWVTAELLEKDRSQSRLSKWFGK
jgi:ribonuclease HII